MVTGIGPAATAEELNRTKNFVVKVTKGQYTNNPELATVTNYLNDTTQQPYQTKADKWSNPKQKTAQWAHASHVGVEKCIVKYSIDFCFGLCEMETFGRRDTYSVIKSVRLSNVNVSELMNINVSVYSIICEMRDNGSVQEMEVEVVVDFDGMKSFETYKKSNRFLMTGAGVFSDI